MSGYRSQILAHRFDFDPCGQRLQELRVRTQRCFIPLDSWVNATPKGQSTHDNPSLLLKGAHSTIKSEPQLVIDSSDTLVAQFRPNKYSKEKTCLEVTPAGMDMLDHIVVTFIPVEVERRKGGG